VLNADYQLLRAETYTNYWLTKTRPDTYYVTQCTHTHTHTHTHTQGDVGDPGGIGDTGEKGEPGQRGRPGAPGSAGFDGLPVRQLVFQL